MVPGARVSGHASARSEEASGARRGAGYRLGSSVRYCTGRQPSRLKNRPCNPRGLPWLFTLPQSMAGVRAAVVG